MAKTLSVLLPAGAELPTSAAPSPTLVNGELVLAYDASAVEAADWKDVVPQAYAGGALTAYLHVRMASATTGETVWTVEVEAVGAGDAGDADSFGAANASGAVTVPASASTMAVIAVALSDVDTLAAGDKVRFRVKRAATDAADTATGDAYLYAVEIREA